MIKEGAPSGTAALAEIERLSVLKKIAEIDRQITLKGESITATMNLETLVILTRDIRNMRYKRKAMWDSLHFKTKEGDDPVVLPYQFYNQINF